MSRVASRQPTLSAPPRLAKRETVVGHVVGLALLAAGLGMVASAIVEKLTHGHDAAIILACGLLVGAPGLALWNRTRPPDRIPAAKVFAAVLSASVSFVLVATVPYFATGTLVGFEQPLFEAVSGLTTTSATVLDPVERASQGLLFWRATTQWIGGIGTVLFAVSVLSFLGVGGMELAQSARSGPASERLAQRVRAAAARLVPLYVVFTALVGFGYVAFGMSTYDAVTHAFTTVSTGGFSTYDRSFAAFASPALEWVAIGAMVVAGGSLALYWRALRGRPIVVLRSAEFRAYFVITAVFSAAAVAWNGARDGFDADLVRQSIFTMVSLTSTTGYRMLDYDRWADVLQLLIVFGVGLGGMAGSAAGGFKVFRLLGVLGYARRQLYGQLHPRAVAVVRFGRDIVPEVVLTRVVGFFGLFMAIGAVGTLLMAAFGEDMRTSISAAASALGNTGPGLGDAGPMRRFSDLHVGTRAVLMVLMVVGRLEVYPVLLGAVPFLRFVGDRLPARVGRAFSRILRG